MSSRRDTIFSPYMMGLFRPETNVVHYVQDNLFGD
ncbi:hypothetical protein SAMN05216268_111202 [Streptomyces yunnanensis]|uniref:Uncharacterized protein n=1 Tax=Streptomyces yunnanensis TaxID=156453 RepID=A0A9X8N049_9ACTN|nr:hypothetical protein SAMN05216268_111202 [Streptomyces yunnanensis]